MQDTKQVIFHLGEGRYGLDIMIVNAIEKYIDVINVPNAPSNVIGIINLRGEVIPVYSLRRKFGLPEKEADEETKLIVTKTNDMVMAYQVDMMEGIIDISKNNIHDVPKAVSCKETNYIRKIADIDGKLVVLLNHDGIVSESEQEMIENLLKENQEDEK